MRKIIFALGLAIAASCVTAQAATHEHDMSQHRATSQPAAAIHKGLGVLKAVNAQAGKVQIAHEPIDTLGWPAMTMWFALREPLPKEVMVSDSVRFELEQLNAKEWVITRIERKK